MYFTNFWSVFDSKNCICSSFTFHLNNKELLLEPKQLNFIIIINGNFKTFVVKYYLNLIDLFSWFFQELICMWDLKYVVFVFIQLYDSEAIYRYQRNFWVQVRLTS